jgi:hypothetical protein
VATGSAVSRQRGRCAISSLFVALRAVGLPCTRKLTSPSSMSTWKIFRCDERQRCNAWWSERFAPTDGWSARVGLPLVGLSRSAWASPHGSRTRRTEAGAEGAEQPPIIQKASLRTPTRCVPRTVHSRKGNPTTTTATTTMHPHARTHACNARAHTHAHSHTRTRPTQGHWPVRRRRFRFQFDACRAGCRGQAARPPAAARIRTAQQTQAELSGRQCGT